MPDPEASLFALLVEGRPISAEVLRRYGQVLLNVANRMDEGKLTVGRNSGILESEEPCGARVISMVLTLHEPRTLN